MTCHTPVVVALDYSSAEKAFQMAEQLDPSLCRVKVGKELFASAGRGVVEGLVARGFDVFLDLKFHDIPNTCAKAVLAAADMGVWMVNVHASGGRRMMEAAAEALQHRQGEKPLLIGVTVLTSMDQSDLDEVGIGVSPAEQVGRLAQLAESSGLDGVVCSAQEVGLIRQQCGAGFLTVTPGIRPAWSQTQDQKRIMTPADAVKAGVDYMVIGRPITQADVPQDACQKVLSELGA